MKQKIRIYAVSIAISLGIGVASAFLTRNNMDIYSLVKTPPLSPPAFLFPLVWTILYILMGIGSAMILTTATSPLSERKNALSVYALSLFFNFFWSIIFFNMRAFLFSFIWLIALLILIVTTIFRYSRINKTAAYLQIPYAIWVAFAGYLNLGIWLLNR